MLSYHWGVWKQNIGKPMRLEGNRSYMMSIAMKWLGEDEVFYYETRTEDDSKLVGQTLAFLDEADFVIAHNGAKFDIPKINAYAITNGLLPPSPYKVIDTLQIARKNFMFERNTLEHLADELGCTPKLKHARFSGFSLWKECMAGNDEAWAEMKEYNIQDIVTLEELYMKLRPWAKIHPNLSTHQESEVHLCPKCSSTNLHRRGYQFSNVSKYQRYRCMDCGSWSRTRYTENSVEARKGLLTNG
jgi:DNA-directed RNA polymerase subunit RPC12/RpoP